MKNKTWKLRLRALCAWMLIFFFCFSSLGMSEALADEGEATEPQAITMPEPNEEPTVEAVEEPTPEPAEEPTAAPAPEPAQEPTAEPTPEPAEEPTAAPTAEPVQEPTAEPTPVPAQEPAAAPTASPALNADPVVIYDEASGVEFVSYAGTLIGDAAFSVKQLPADPVQSILAEAVADSGLTLADARVYDITLLGAELAGSIVVNLPIPASFEGEVAVWHIAEDGTVAKMDGAREGDVYTFKTTHFSLYALTNATEPTRELSEEPAVESVEEPAAEPTAEPAEEPTAEPTPDPAQEPTAEPTAEPAEEPTAEPTPDPAQEPTAEPAPDPAQEPTAEPTADPAQEPTAEPTASPALNADPVVIFDEASGVEFVSQAGTLIGDAAFTVNEIPVDPVDPADTVYSILAEAVADSGLMLVDARVYDITLLGAELAGSIVVNLPIPASFEGEVAVWHIAEDGTVAKMDGAREGDVYTFETTHFSLYALTSATEATQELSMLSTDAEGGKVTPTNTGVRFHSAGVWIIMMLLCAMLSLSLFLTRRNWRNQEES